MNAVYFFAKMVVLKYGFKRGYKGKKEIKCYYKSHPELVDNEIHELLAYLDNHKLRIYNYSFYDEYDWNFSVKTGEINGDNYVNHNGYMMYFPDCYDELAIAYSYRNRIAEQDSRSPHCYEALLKPNDEYDVIVDGGASEGIFILNNIKQLSEKGRVVAVETDEKWRESLKKTIEASNISEDNYSIIPKFLSNVDDENNVSIDGMLRCGIIKSDDRVLIKMDIEGAEEIAIAGSIETIASCKSVTFLICTYHHHTAYRDICSIFEKQGLELHHTVGYMYFPPQLEDELMMHKDDPAFPEFRRGVIRADKRNY